MSDEASVRFQSSLIVRLFLRAPVLLYRVGCADLLAERGFLLLFTRGWRTGRRRVSALNYVREDTTVYIAAGWGERTAWYRNLLADPMVEVQIGRRRMAARARPVTDPVEKKRSCAMLGAVDMGPPKPLRPALRRLGFDYDAERARAFADPARVTLVALELAERVESEQRAGARRSLTIPLVSAAAVLAALVLAAIVRARRQERGRAIATGR